MSKVVIKSNIESNGMGGWWIRLTDTVDGREMFCQDMAEFEKNIEFMGDDYGGDIEVQWSKDANVSPENFHEVELAMHAHKEEMNIET
jgi:hypothetical protein